jgi:hypothetical protein
MLERKYSKGRAVPKVGCRGELAGRLAFSVPSDADALVPRGKPKAQAEAGGLLGTDCYSLKLV